MVIVFSGLLLVPVTEGLFDELELLDKAFIEAFLIAFGVLDPNEEILGMDFELKLADLELCKLGVLGASAMDLSNFGDPNLSQN